MMLSNRGFTLIELVIVIVILGVISIVVVPRIGQFIGISKDEATKAEMMELKAAIAGEDGYKVHVGADLFNFDLTGLVTKPASVAAWDKFNKIGWNGPYISDDGSESYKFDAWGNAYVVTATTITSAGANGIIGDADDHTLNY